MNLEEIEKLIDNKIRQHEIRVGWISGVIVALFTFGVIHAIWMIKQWIL
jgi:Mg/Co/Ni transporter MgtE